jgi:hypothetical protein
MGLGSGVFADPFIASSLSSSFELIASVYDERVL